MIRLSFLLSIFLSVISLQSPVSAQSYGDAFTGFAEQSALRYGYIADVAQQVRKFWRPEFSIDNKPAIFEFEIKRDGSASRIQMKRSSHNNVGDQSARLAIEKSSPFKPLPAELNDTEKVRLEFYSAIQSSSASVNALKDGDSIVCCALCVPSERKETSQSELMSYASELERQVKSAWIMPADSGEAEFTFILQRTGKISNLRLTTASRSDSFDRSALEAVRAAAPFAPLPQNRPDSAIVSMTFKKAPPLPPIEDEPVVSRTAQVDVDFGPYMELLQQKIRSNWAPSSDKMYRRTVLTFKTDAEGVISNIRLKERSGNDSIDQEAMSAIWKASPLPPLPEGCPPDVDIHYTFVTVATNSKTAIMKASLCADCAVITSSKTHLTLGASNY